MKVIDLGNRNVVSVSPEENLIKALQLMEKNKFNQLPIVSNKKYLGMIFLKDIIERGLDAEKTKIKRLLVNTPSIKEEEEIKKDFLNFFIEVGLRALPITRNKNLVGIISETDLIKLVKSDLKVKEIMNKPICIEENENIGKARSLFYTYNIARLPVIDYEGNIKGIIDYFDLIKIAKVPKQRIESLGTAAEKVHLERLLVKNLMHEPKIIDENITLTQVSKILQNNEEVIITKKRKPIGIVTPKDLLEVLVSKVQRTVVQVSHYSNIAEKMEIEEEVQKFLEYLWRRFEDVSYFYIYMDKHKEKGRSKYSLRARIMTSKGLIIAKSFDWSLINSLKKLFKLIKRSCEKLKES